MGQESDETHDMNHDFIEESENQASEFNFNIPDDSFELLLQKKLAKIILDNKYLFNTSQLSINDTLGRFKNFFLNGIDGINVNIFTSKYFNYAFIKFKCQSHNCLNLILRHICYIF